MAKTAAKAKRKPATKKIPDGFHSVTPYIVVRGGLAAHALYVKAFGAKVVFVMAPPGSKKVMHSAVLIGNSLVFVCDENDWMKAPRNGVGGAQFYLYVDDADAVHKQAVKAGMKEVSAPQDMFWGDRVGSLAYASPEQLEGERLDSRSDMYSLGAVLYHLIAGRPPLDAATPAAMMQQIYHQRPESLVLLRAGVDPALDALIQRALAKLPKDRFPDWDAFAQALADLVAKQLIPRGESQSVLDSERFTLLRQLEFFAEFGDVDLWDVVHRASWQRFLAGQSLYRKGDAGDSFHIIAQGEVEVFRDGDKVARLGAGTSVGEMAYLAPSAALRKHSADVHVTKPTASVSFTPQTLARLNATTRHAFDQAFIRVLVRRLHAAHESMAHPRRVL